MLHRPTNRRRSRKESEEISLNLVPMLDALVTIIAFLLVSMSVILFVGIDSVVPIVSKSSLPERIKQKPLQLTVSISERDTEIWSPFQRVKTSTIPHNQEGLPDTMAIHEVAMGIKQQFLTETKVVLVPHKGITYDVLIAVMDALREVEKTDPPFFQTNPTTGVEEQVQRLFPEVIFGNLLGEG